MPQSKTIFEKALNELSSDRTPAAQVYIIEGLIALSDELKALSDKIDSINSGRPPEQRRQPSL